jgi:hypothetical protein
MARLVYFFNAKALLILAIITAKIIYLGFLASYTSKVAPIIQIFRVSGLFKLSIVFCVVSYLGLNSVLNKKLVLGKELILNLGLDFLSVFL